MKTCSDFGGSCCHSCHDYHEEHGCGLRVRPLPDGTTAEVCCAKSLWIKEQLEDGKPVLQPTTR